MASTTKQAIVASFLKLCARKSPDKITVRDIVDDCEINRNTCYYYFQDIYALIEEVFRFWARDFIAECEAGNRLENGLSSLTEQILTHRKAAISLLLSFDSVLLEDHWFRATADAWVGWVRCRAEKLTVSEQAIRYVGMTYALGFFGILRRWIRGSMKVDSHKIVLHYEMTWLCGVEEALLRYESEFGRKETEE